MSEAFQEARPGIFLFTATDQNLNSAGSEIDAMLRDKPAGKKIEGVIIDCAKVTYANAGHLGMLLRIKKALHDFNAGSLILSNVSDDPHSILQVTGLSSNLITSPNNEFAIQRLEQPGQTRVQG